MRISGLLWMLLGVASAFGQITPFQPAPSQAGCPAVSFSSAGSAALTLSSTARRVLVKQTDGSYSAFEIDNTLPYELHNPAPSRVLRTIPHFEKLLRTCVPSITGIAAPPVMAVARTSSGGYVFATNDSGEVKITTLDANLGFVGQTTETAVASVVFADFNGDGIMDFIGTGFTSGPEPDPTQPQPVSVFLGGGGGSFQVPLGVDSGAAITGSILVADVNGDHKPDLVVSTQLPSGIWMLPGNGDGTFQPPRQLLPVSMAYSITLADLNGDGKLDLVFADVDSFYRPLVEVALGLGTGTFGPPATLSVGEGGPIAIGDANGDGIPDIVTGGRTGNISILFGDGKGGFPDRHGVLLAPVGSSLRITDFDGDGVADIVSVSLVSGSANDNASVIAGDTISVLFGRGSGTFSGPPVSLIPNFPAGTTDPNINTIGGQITALAAADLNRDGIPDLVAAFPGKVAVLKGSGDGSFEFTDSFVFDSEPTAIVFADFNLDGRLDFAVAGNSPPGGAIEIALGNGDGTFQSPIKIPTPAGPVTLAVGDFNGDGKPDLAVTTFVFPSGGSDLIQILLGNGDGAFSPGAIYTTSPGTVSIVAGDFNADGKLDLIVANEGTAAHRGQDGILMLLAGKGDGTFAAPAIIPLTGTGSFGPSNLLAADFNRDGKPDLAVTLGGFTGEGGLVILLGRGDGTFQPPVTYAAPTSSIAAGDLNGDGIPDVVTSGGDYLMRYQLGNGDGSFQPPVGFSAGEFPVSSPVALADFNRDGRLDIATAAGGIDVFLNSSQPSPSIAIVSAASLAPGPLAPDSIATAFGTGLPANPSISIKDSAGSSQTASLIYSSSSQINFYIPQGFDAGPATVTIGSLSVPIVLDPIAPSLFVANTQGLAAAYVTRVLGSTVTNEPVFKVLNGVVVPAPIDVTDASGQVYLVLFGTGIRGAAGAVQSDSGPLEVLYAGPQPAFPGLDQVNIILPSSLAGTGDLRIQLLTGSEFPPSLVANPVYITIK